MTQEYNSILLLRHDVSEPIEKMMTSGRDASRAIYCEPGFRSMESS